MPPRARTVAIERYFIDLTHWESASDARLDSWPVAKLGWAGAAELWTGLLY